MKSFFNLSILFAALFLVVACGEAPKGEKAETGEAIEANATTETTTTTTTDAKKYAVVVNSSKLYWEGTKLMGGGHKGSANVQSGEILVKDNEIIGGSVVIDMNSIANSDIEDASKKADLEGHLKSDDFFDVANHPTATFEVVKAEVVAGKPNVTHNVTGNLTMKNITKSIIIPVSISMQGNEFAAKTASFTINRTEWEVKFHSGLVEKAKDRIINDEVGMQFNITAAIQ